MQPGWISLPYLRLQTCWIDKLELNILVALIL